MMSHRKFKLHFHVVTGITLLGCSCYAVSLGLLLIRVLFMITAIAKLEAAYKPELDSGKRFISADCQALRSALSRRVIRGCGVGTSLGPFCVSIMVLLLSARGISRTVAGRRRLQQANADRLA